MHTYGLLESLEYVRTFEAPVNMSLLLNVLVSLIIGSSCHTLLLIDFDKILQGKGFFFFFFLYGARLQVRYNKDSLANGVFHGTTRQVK